MNRKRSIMIESTNDEIKILGTREDIRNNSIILAMDQNHFKVVKCGDSYNFKTYRDLQKYSIEDAERLIKTPKVRGSKSKMNEDEDVEEEVVEEKKKNF